MPNYNELKPLKIKPIVKEPFVVKKYAENVFLFLSQEKDYIIVKHDFKMVNDSYSIDNVHVKGGYIETKNFDENLALSSNFGGDNDFIVDMNGIDNFIFAKSMVFNDSTIRTMILQLGLLDENKSYLRIGVSGSRSRKGHPGGEVFEYQVLSGNFAEGITKSVSGYLSPPELQYSRSIPLSIDGQYLLDERIVYSHTAWLEKLNKPIGKSIHFKIHSNNDKNNLLDLLNSIMEQLGYLAYSIQMCIVNSSIDNKIIVKGRVLKHMPKKPFNEVQEATDIAVEKEFELPTKSKLYILGTQYDRYEPEWGKFTNGHKYERRGHYHGTIVNIGSENPLHQTFHLREIWLGKNTCAEIVLNPINNVYRIYPVHKNKEKLICDSTGKNVVQLIDELNSYYSSLYEK